MSRDRSRQQNVYLAWVRLGSRFVDSCVYEVGGAYERRNQCIREGVRIRTRCVYTEHTLPLAKSAPTASARTLRSIRTLGCVNAPTRVYAPTAASIRMCVYAAWDAYTHLPAYTHPTLRTRVQAAYSTPGLTPGRDERNDFTRRVQLSTSAEATPLPWPLLTEGTY